MTTRKDNCEYFNGRDAFRAGLALSDNPHSASDDSDSRHARWALGYTDESEGVAYVAQCELVANTTRACYWRTPNGFAALAPDALPAAELGGYARLDSLMSLKGESAETIRRTLAELGPEVTSETIAAGVERLESRVAEAEPLAAEWERLATRAHEIAHGPNAAALRASDLAGARHIGDVLRGFANGMADNSAAAASASLAGLAHGVYRLAGDALAIRRSNETLTASLAQADKAAGDRNAAIRDAAALSQADASQLRGSPFAAARIMARYAAAFAEGRDAADLAGFFDAALELERQACAKAGEAREATESLHRKTQSLADSRAVAERLTGEVATYREQRDSEGARAVAAEARAEAAERQLAEYRSLMSALPAGLALNPAVMPLLKAYLADAETRP